MRSLALLTLLLPVAHAADLESLYQIGRFFELRDAMPPGAGDAFYRAQLAIAFNDIAQAEREFAKVVKTRDRGRILSVALALAQSYELAGRRKSLRELVHRVESIRGSSSWGDALESLRTHRKVFGDYPDQSAMWHGPSRLMYAYVDRKLTVPVQINGTPANYVLDTGAPSNSISAAEAKRLGLTVHDAPLAVGYVFHDLKPGGIAIADDLVIGNLHLRNVLFQVAPEGMPGILGLPVMMAMGTIRWNSNGSFEFGFPSGPRELASANLCLFGPTPLVKGEIANRAAVFALDTGSDVTLLFPNFTKDFARIAKSAMPGNEDALGDIVKDPNAKLIDELFVSAGGLRLRTATAVLMSKDINGPTPAHGLLGMDVLEQSRSVTLDFQSMRMIVEGIDAGPVPATNERSCPLPAAFACAAGARCVLQTDHDGEICLLERVPREPWPGNPVIDDVIENGKRCPLGENLICPAGKSCHAVFQSNQSCAFVIQDPVRVTEDTSVSAAAPIASTDARNILQRVLKNDLFDIAPPRDYVFLEEHETKYLNADGSVKNITTETREVMNLYNAEYSRLIRRNGNELPAAKARAEQVKFDKAVEKRAHETPEAKAKREVAERKQAEKNRTCEEAILQSFDFRVTGTETMNGRASWMIEADPLPRLRTGCAELTVLGMFKQKFRIDQADYRMARWEGDTGSFHLGGILLRVPAEGIHFVHEQRRNADGTWLLMRQTIKMNARVLGVKVIREEDAWTYSNYRKFAAESKLLP